MVDYCTHELPRESGSSSSPGSRKSGKFKDKKVGEERGEREVIAGFLQTYLFVHIWCIGGVCFPFGSD